MGLFHSPLRYPGGKNCVFPFVSKLFYENNLIGSSYAEPYAGGAGLALRLLHEGYTDHVYINDLDKSIYSFWKTIIEHPDEFCSWIDRVNVSVWNWKKFRKIQLNKDEVSQFDLAKSTFFLNRTNVSGVLKGGVIGGLEQKGKYKIDARFNKADLIKRIMKIADSGSRITVSNEDGLKFLHALDKKSENIFFYLDPPYMLKGADLYMNFYSKNDHAKLSKKVTSLNNRWLVSYDNHPFILNLYKEQKKILHKLSQSASNRVGNEIFIFSEGFEFYSSMSALKSPELV